MKNRSAHEPNAKLLDAAEVKQDAQTLATVLQKNMLKVEPMVRLQIPLSLFLSALDSFSRDELVLLQQRVQEKLAA